MEKGDNGKIEFLEGAVGLSLSSAMNVARHLSAETLPGLIEKVNYVKKIFFSDSSDGGLTGKNARRMMMHLSIPIDDDLQQTLSFFVKVGVEEKDVGRMLIKYPWILSMSIQENFKEVSSFFELEKVPKLSVGRAIRSWPHILGCSTSMLKLMVEEIGELGIRNKKLDQVISRSPQLLIWKPQEFLQKILVWLFHEFPFYIEDEIPKNLFGSENLIQHAAFGYILSVSVKDLGTMYMSPIILGFDKETVGSILGCCPKIFAASIGKTLKRKLEFLASNGVSEPHLLRVIKKYPELLISDTDRTLLPRMKYLMKKGLSWRGIAFMVRKFSPLLGYSIEDVLSPKLEFLVNTMEKPVTDLVEYPRYFSYSLEKRIKPRYWVLKGRNIEFSLRDMLARQ